MGIGKKILLLLLAVFVIMQFFRIDRTNPKVNKAKGFIALTNPPAEIESMIRSACYDCHSNETEYPWYSNVAPVSWIIGNHVEEGREYINFSTWADYSEDKANHKLHECEEEVECDGSEYGHEKEEENVKRVERPARAAHSMI